MKQPLNLLSRVLHYISNGTDSILIVLSGNITQFECINGNLDCPSITLVNVWMTARVVQGMKHLILQLICCADSEKGSRVVVDNGAQKSLGQN